MTNDGRFWVRDTRTGRVFCVEPIADRSQRINGHEFTNGGISGDEVKNSQRGGSIRAEESIITPENGFTNIALTANPLDEIARLLA